MNQPNIKLQNASAKRIAYIEASWHKDIVGQARLGFTAAMDKAGIKESQIAVFHVPGSLEIPLQAQMLAKSGDYDLIVAAGMIVDGGIYRHEFVAATVLDAMMQVQLETEIPVLSVVLTPQNFHDSAEHQAFFFDHFKIKGEEAANAALMTLANVAAFDKQAKAA